MDKFILSQLVKELILENGQVVLPGFGVISARPYSASFSEDGRIINPPTKKIVFTEDTSIEDNLLVERFAHKLNEPVESFIKPSEAFIRELASEAVSGESAELPGLGSIVFSETEGFLFKADADRDIFAERDGLEPIRLRIVEREEPEEIVPEETSPEPEPEPGENKEPEAILPEETSAAPSQVIEAEPGKKEEPVIPAKSEEQKPEPKPEQKPEHRPEARHELEPADRHHRLFVTIIIFLGAVIIISILYILGCNGAFDSLLYSEDELELMKSLK